MKYLNTKPLPKIVRTVHDRAAPMAIVLTYHRITENIVDPQRLVVNPAKFSRHLDVLAETISLFCLPRFGAGDWDGEAFEEKLEDFIRTPCGTPASPECISRAEKL